MPTMPGSMFIWMCRKTKRKSTSDSRRDNGKMFERVISTAMQRMMKKLGGKYWFKRLYDYQTFIQVNPSLQCVKQPGDYMACLNGQFIIFECKSSHSPRYDLRFISENQTESAIIIEQAGGKYWFLVYGWADKIYAFRPTQWFHMKAEIFKQGYKSASWADMETYATLVITRDSSKAWNVDKLLEMSMPEPQNPRRRLSFMTAKDYVDATAVYRTAYDDIVIFYDSWTKEGWKNWGVDKFIDYLCKDMSISMIHELIHWATEPTIEREMGGEIEDKWEAKVEQTARSAYAMMSLVQRADPNLLDRDFKVPFIDLKDCDSKDCSGCSVFYLCRGACAEDKYKRRICPETEWEIRCDGDCRTCHLWDYKKRKRSK